MQIASWAEAGTQLAGFARWILTLAVMFYVFLVVSGLVWILVLLFLGWLGTVVERGLKLLPGLAWLYGEELDPIRQDREQPVRQSRGAELCGKDVRYTPIEANDRRTVYAGEYGPACDYFDLIHTLPQERPGGYRYMQDFADGKFTWVVVHPRKKAGES